MLSAMEILTLSRLVVSPSGISVFHCFRQTWENMHVGLWLSWQKHSKISRGKISRVSMNYDFFKKGNKFRCFICRIHWSEWTKINWQGRDLNLQLRWCSTNWAIYVGGLPFFVNIFVPGALDRSHWTKACRTARDHAPCYDTTWDRSSLGISRKEFNFWYDFNQINRKRN